jgi:hypothetical protein
VALPADFLRVAGGERALNAGEVPEALRREIEPWLAAVFQSEHLSLLAGSGLPIAIANVAEAPIAGMATVDFGGEDGELISKAARDSAARTARGRPNLEDQIRVAIQLVGGLEILGDISRAESLRKLLDQVLASVVDQILAMERGLGEAVDARTAGGAAAADLLVSFLLSFAGRAASRERVNVFTTNYDRFIEFATDLAGVRVVDRFVGGLSPVFRASRLDVDLHYNPPGMRGEPRYLEGVVRLTKLHGSIDWSSGPGGIRRLAVPFGGTFEPSKPSQSLMVFPNPAKDRETLEYPYAELFRDLASALCRPNSALVTYGYGFGDDHINRVILDMLSIPSTHVAIIAFGDPDDRIETFIRHAQSDQQITVLLGPLVAGIENLVHHYLPRPAMEPIQLRRAAIERQRSAGQLPAGRPEEDE